MNTTKRFRTLGVTAIAVGLLGSACSVNGPSEEADHDHDGTGTTHTHDSTTTTTAAAESTDDGAAASDWLGSYTLTDEDFGTQVTVTVAGDTRTIETNALPDHETGEFPNSGNPNSISAQDLTWEFPLEPTVTGEATEVRVTGVALNGVKFEPGTAETVVCDSGETYRIEAITDVYDLGLDFNNAHVQPTGEYHYHGVPDLLVDAYSSDEDLVHVGFAADGHLIYYSKSGAYESSYVLSDEARSGTGCTESGPAGGDNLELDGTTPDGSYDLDWVYSEDVGDLDECNGTVIDGEYAYVMTDNYPYVGRCVMGEPAAGTAGGGAPPGGGLPGGGPPR